MIATLKIIHYSEQIIIKLKLNHEQVKSEEVQVDQSEVQVRGC
jgi:hypothetical protein